MDKSIELHNRKVGYTLKLSNRAKHLRLSVYRGGAFVVTAPPSASPETIEGFIVQKSRWVLGKIDYFKAFSKGTQLDYAQNKNRALLLAYAKVEFFNEVYKFKFRKVSIRSQKTRWGSCSGKGNLNFNYRIAALPERLVDYIVVHELCHLAELNHSKRFWALVSKSLPNYKDLNAELKKIG